MKKYICYLETAWCGEINKYSFIAKNRNKANHIAKQLVINNFYNFIKENNIAKTLFFEYKNLKDPKSINKILAEYYSYSVDEFTGTDEEFDKLDKELYFK